MKMMIDFPGGAQVEAKFGNFTVSTDQPPSGGGQGAFPTPFALFLSSLGTCAGIYVLGFCRQRGLPTDGIRIIQTAHKNSFSGMIDKIELEIQVPCSFPEKYHDSLVRSAELCAVKKNLETPPEFSIKTRVIEKG